MGKQGELALYQLKLCALHQLHDHELENPKMDLVSLAFSLKWFLTLLRTDLPISSSYHQYERISSIFVKWASLSKPDTVLNASDLRKTMTAWVQTHLNGNFEMPRQRLLAMMRLIDTDKDGTIDYADFRNLCENALKEQKEEEAAIKHTGGKNRMSNSIGTVDESESVADGFANNLKLSANEQKRMVV
jgi:hypothetical protein